MESWSSPGFFLVIVASQLAMLLTALGSAWLSPVPLRERLGLRRGRLHPRTWPLLAVGSVPVLWVGAIAVSLLFPEPSEHMEGVTRSFTEASPVWVLVLLASVSLLPGFAEEALFRGYVQRRLLRRWPTWLAIGFTSLMFAAIHVDVYQALSVTPIAFWLGYVAWRADSTIPCVICHAFVNLVGVGLPVLGGGAIEEHAENTIVGLAAMGILALAIAAFVGSVLVLRRAGRD